MKKPNALGRPALAATMTVLTAVVVPHAQAMPFSATVMAGFNSESMVTVLRPADGDLAQIGQVTVGHGATITTNSSTEKFTGTVSFVSDTAEFTPNTIDTPDQRTKLVFAVRVRVDDSSGTLKSGMPVDVRLS